MINAIKLILGITIGLLTLGILTGAAGYYFFVPSITTKPQRPKFAEEGKPKPVVKASAKPKKEEEEKPEPEPSQSPLPPGAYGASVIWETGVSLREEPDNNSGKSGSVGFREKVTVLKTSPDKQWVMVRNSDNSQEGWLKIGNVEREAGN
jgi:Bacterial SH3 domain